MTLGVTSILTMATQYSQSTKNLPPGTSVGGGGGDWGKRQDWIGKGGREKVRGGIKSEEIRNDNMLH